MDYAEEIDTKINELKNGLLNDLAATKDARAITTPSIKRIEKCPSCGNVGLIHASGCIECICGWSACS